jgi:hypothetical protein
MRFRTDGWHYADLKTHGWTRERFVEEYKERVPDYLDKFEATPIAEPGDVWCIHWYKEGIEQGPLAGYAICCIKCGHVHNWTTAGNCQTDVQAVHYTGTDGSDQQYPACAHKRTGAGSCWNWSGSAEDNTLTASPSLLVTDQKCGFHGWLQDGELRAC